jgi:hypothetical protein
MFIARQRTGRTQLPPFSQDLDRRMGSENMQVPAELGHKLERSRRSLGATFQAFVRAMPTRCRDCGGRVVRTDPMAAKSCNACGRWAE